MYIYELTDFIISDEDKNIKFVAFQIVTQSLQNLNYGQEFLVVIFIPSLCWDYVSRKKS